MIRSTLINLYVAIHVALAAQDSYRIELTQKDSYQYAEYDVRVPPLDQFTFCMWLRPADFKNDQAIFTYLVNKEPMITIWLESGGTNLHSKISRGHETIAPVDWKESQWYHVCMTWLSQSGAWALYSDGVLVSCETSDKIQYETIPGGGRMLMGAPDTSRYIEGWEGIIQDFVMITASTLDNTISSDRNVRLTRISEKILPVQTDNYNTNNYNLDTDLTEEDSFSDYEMEINIPTKQQSFVKFRTPFSKIEHDVGLKILPLDKLRKQLGNIHEHRELIMPNLNQHDNLNTNTENQEYNNVKEMMKKIWSVINLAGHMGKFNTNMQEKQDNENQYPTLSELETPPPPHTPLTYQEDNIFTDMLPPLKTISDVFNSSTEQNKEKKFQTNAYIRNNNEQIIEYNLPTLSQVETPPAPVKDNNFYGHWIGGTAFSNSVLQFLKNNKNNRVPNTIPLKKGAGVLPYASEQIITAVPFRSNLDIERSLPFSFSVIKRHVRSPEINIKILNKNPRLIIAEQHAKERAVNVKVIPRSSAQNNYESDSQETRNSDTDNTIVNGFAYSLSNHNMDSKLPLRKSPGFSDDETMNDNLFYWHNLHNFNEQLYNHNIDNSRFKNHIDDNIFSDNLNLHSLPHLFFQHTPEKTNMSRSNNRAVNKDFSLNSAKGFVTIAPLSKRTNRTKERKHRNDNKYYNSAEDTFSKSVKLGNALNEDLIIGKHNDEDNIFFGGDDNVPDINRFRSDTYQNDVSNPTPPSLRASICNKASQVIENVFQGDFKSVHLKKPPGLNLLLYHRNNKCGDGGNSLKRHILYRWRVTPVRLFGGAQLKKSHGFCE